MTEKSNANAFYGEKCLKRKKSTFSTTDRNRK